MPLVWAHSEHIKLLRSLRDGAVFDLPPQSVKRYIEGRSTAQFRSWRFNNKIRALPAGKLLRIELLSAAQIHWSCDHWHTIHDSNTVMNDFGIHVVDLPVAGLSPGGEIAFTFFWLDAGTWENVDFVVDAS